MKRLFLALALIVAAGPALAQEPPHAQTPDEVSQAVTAPEPPKPVLTADEGKKLYEYGLKVGMAQGMARAAMETATQDAKPVLEKLQPPAAPKP